MPFSSRKFAEWLYGGHQPRDVGLAVGLGILTGALSGGNASWAFALLAAMVLNVHTRLFLCAWPAGALAAWLGHRGLETVGHFLLDATPLGRTLGQHGDDLLVSLLGWDQYAVVGGAALGALAAFVFGCVFYAATVRLNRSWYASPPRPPAGPAAQGAIHASSIQPAVVCVWYGPSRREQVVRRRSSPRRLRPRGISSALAASVALAASCWWLASRHAERNLWQQLSAYYGGAVAAESSEFSLWTGRFMIRELCVPDPQGDGRDRLCVGAVKGTLSPGLLLRGYLHIDNLALERVRLEAARRATPRHASDPAVELSWRRDDARPGENDLVLNHHLRHWNIFCRQLGGLRQVIGAIEQLCYLEQCHTTGGPARSQLGVTRPRVEARRVRIADLASGWNLGRKALLEAKNLSSHSGFADRQPELRLILPNFGAEIEIAFADGDACKHRVRCSMCNLELSEVVDSPYASHGVCFHAGRAKLIGTGTCDADRFDLQLEADIDSLRADVSSEERLAGIELKTWQAGLTRLGGFHARLALTGPWSSPTLTLERRELIEGFQRKLRLAGEEELLHAVSVQLAQQNLPEKELAVVQASVIDREVEAHPPGFCDFSEEALPSAEDQLVPAAAIATEALRAGYPEQPAAPYPTTRLVEQPAGNLPLAEAILPPVRRPLPGPVNMAVGHDPASAVVSTGSGARSVDGASAPRENVLSRWSRALREKFSRSGDDPTATDVTPAAAPVLDRVPPREPAAAAASEAWYNRRWR